MNWLRPHDYVLEILEDYGRLCVKLGVFGLILGLSTPFYSSWPGSGWVFYIAVVILCVAAVFGACWAFGRFASTLEPREED